MSLYDSNRDVVAKATVQLSETLDATKFNDLPPIGKREEQLTEVANAGAALAVLYTSSTPGMMKQRHHTLQPTILTPMEKLPINLKWEKLARSRFVEDETVLRHIPYVGDDDGTFINDLYENYDSAMVFDEAQEEENKLSDRVIKKIVEACLRDMPDIAASQDAEEVAVDYGAKAKASKTAAAARVWGGASDADAGEDANVEVDADAEQPAPKRMVSHHVIEALMEVMGSAVTADALEEKIAGLLSSPEPGNEQAADANGDADAAAVAKEQADADSAPAAPTNVDSQDAAACASFEPKAAADSYIKLLCRRCFCYDCLHHGHQPRPRRTPGGPVKHLLGGNGGGSSVAPCSDACGRVTIDAAVPVPISQSSSGSGRSRSSVSAGGKMKHRKGAAAAAMKAAKAAVEAAGHARTLANPTVASSSKSRKRQRVAEDENEEALAEAAADAQDGGGGAAAAGGNPGTASAACTHTGAPFTDLERALVLKGAAIFSSRDPCAVAKFVRIRTCKEVAELMAIEGVGDKDVAEDVPVTKKASWRKLKKAKPNSCKPNFATMKKVEQMLINRYEYRSCCALTYFSASVGPYR